MSNILSLFPNIYTVLDDGCWVYNGPLGKAAVRKGRPVAKIGSKVTMLARLLCAEKHGPPSDLTMHAAHSCHRAECINPDHLRWKTPGDNQSETPPKSVSVSRNRGSSYVVQRIVGGVRHRKYLHSAEDASQYAKFLEKL